MGRTLAERRTVVGLAGALVIAVGALSAPAGLTSGSVAPDGVHALKPADEEARYARAAVAVHRHEDHRYACSGVAVLVARVVVVLTAGHCVTKKVVLDGTDPWRQMPAMVDFRGRAGKASTPPLMPGVTLRGGKDRTAGPLVPAEHIAALPGWSWGAGGPDAPEADAAIIKPAGPLPGVVPVSIGVPAEGEEGRTLGWGITRLDGEPPAMVHSASVRTVAARDCAEMKLGLTVGDLCVSGEGIHTCAGGSGGPILIRGTVVGIASRAHKGCTGPAIYTATGDAFVAWAEAVVRTWSRASIDVAFDLVAPRGGR